MVNDRLDNTFRGARNLQLNRTTKNLVGQGDRVDFYKFTASSQVDFSLSLSRLRENADVKLLNGNRVQVAASNQLGKQSEQILATLESGTYYIQVKFIGRKGSTRYNLRASTTLAEPGETTATARNLGLFSGEYSTQDLFSETDTLDYYKFTLPQISNFNANIDGLSARAYMELYFDANNNGLIDNGERLETGYDEDNIARTMLAGNYFLAVSQYRQGGIVPISSQYNLYLSATPDPSNLVSDPGNTTTTAYNLENFLGNQTLKDFVGAFDTVDYYKFSLNTTRSFNANIDGLSGRAYMQLYLDANNNGLIDNGERLETGYDEDNIAITLSTGNYFLTVSEYTSGVQGISTRYDLTVSIS